MVNTSGIITTIAGNGNIGNTGDGGAATAAEINHPHSVRLDKMGYIYVSCASKIRKISPMGIISTVAGTDSFGYNGDNIAATNALLDIPVGIAIDDTGNLFIAENAGHRIRKVTTLGIITTIAGNGIGGYNGDGISATAAEIYYPGGVAVDTYDNIYISDGGNGRIRSIRAFVSVPTITNSANGLIAYPNPFTDQTTILYGNKDGEVYDFILYNAQGQVVRSERDNKGGSITISKGNMAEGVYYYRLSNKNGVVYTGKLVVM
jgi:hypothetical protein